MTTALPVVDNLMPAIFGNPPLIELYGYDLSTTVASAGDIVDMDIAWRSHTSEIQVGYTIFIHLADNDERIIAQVDAIPVGGTRPTTSWRQDEVFLDQHLISIPQDGPPGTYNLWIGFYDASTGLRLPVSVDGQQPGDRLLLQEFLVDD
jgi:hypothetical protein